MKSFLDLPLETRVQVYHHLFPVVELRIDVEIRTRAGGQKDRVCSSSLIDCSGQLLRTCRTILTEARPVLMEAVLVSFTRHVDAYYRLTKCLDIESHPRARDVRRLTIDIDAEDASQLKVHSDGAPNLPMIDFLEITCRSVDWQTNSLTVSHPRKTPVQYDIIHKDLVEAAVQLLVGTRLDTLEDKSKNGVKVILQLVRTKGSSNDTAVSPW